ncbi:hypothetical protein D0859_01937, partial [Hortaea werneckii]
PRPAIADSDELRVNVSDGCLDSENNIHIPSGGLRLDTCEALELDRQLCQHETSVDNFTSSTHSWHIMPRVYPPIEGKQPSVAISPSLNESVAGFTAGVVSTLVVHPFDVIKTRLQIEQNEKTRPGGSLRVMRSIAQEAALHGGHTGATKMQDVIRSFYRGLMPNMIGNSVSWALYFMWYGNIKDLVRSAQGSGTQLNSSDYFLASGMSGILTAVFTNPIWVIKTRMLSTARNAPGAYRSIAHGSYELYRTEGVRGFYRGLLPSLFGVSHGAIQFMAYEQLKNKWALKRKGGQAGLTNFDFLYLSAASKMFAGSITYPYQVVRARLQLYDARERYKGAMDVVRQVFQREGVTGFYKGLGPNIIRVLPSTCVTFLVYENMKFYLPRMWQGNDFEE